MWSAEGTLAATLCWPAAWYTSARVCPGLVVPRLVPMAVEWGWALARRALVASAEAVAGSVVVALEPELVEVLLLLLPGCPRLFQVGRGPARYGCTRVGSRLILVEWPLPVQGASVPMLVPLLPVRPRVLLAPEGALPLLPRGA